MQKSIHLVLEGTVGSSLGSVIDLWLVLCYPVAEGKKFWMGYFLTPCAPITRMDEEAQSLSLFPKSYLNSIEVWNYNEL